MLGLIATTVVQTAMLQQKEAIAFKAYLETLSQAEQEKTLALREKHRQERIEAARHAELVEAAKPQGMSGLMGFILGMAIFN